jgi:hypothetical protein
MYFETLRDSVHPQERSLTFLIWDGLVQLLRFYVHNQYASWMRQKASSLYQPVIICIS